MKEKRKNLSGKTNTNTLLAFFSTLERILSFPVSFLFVQLLVQFPVLRDFHKSIGLERNEEQWDPESTVMTIIKFLD